MRSIDSIMGEIATEAAEIELVEKLEERERDRAVRVERILAEHARRADRIALGRATRELAVALQRSEEGHDAATLALGRYRAFVAELLDCLPAADDLEHVAATMSGVRSHYESARASDGAMEGIARIERCIDALLAIQIATERPAGKRARKALEGRRES